MARVDAERNRSKILAAARGAFEAGDADVSMAEVARRAEVGMATLYRNFPGRRELLEALYTDEVDGIVGTAESLGLEAWLRRFLQFKAGKHEVAMELLGHADGEPVLDGGRTRVLAAGRTRVLAAGRPLLVAAQAAGEVRADLSLEQVLDMVIAIAKINRDPEYVEPILRAAFDGLRPA